MIFHLALFFLCPNVLPMRCSWSNSLRNARLSTFLARLFARHSASCCFLIFSLASLPPSARTQHAATANLSGATRPVTAPPAKMSPSCLSSSPLFARWLCQIERADGAGVHRSTEREKQETHLIGQALRARKALVERRAAEKEAEVAAV